MSKWITTKEASDLLGISRDAFKRFKSRNHKSERSEAIKGLKEKLGGNGSTNKYWLSDVEKIKPIFDASKTFELSDEFCNSETAAKILGINVQTFYVYRNRPEKSYSSLAEPISKLKPQSVNANGRWFKVSDVEAIANVDHREELACAYPSCDNKFYKRTKQHRYCSRACKDLHKNLNRSGSAIVKAKPYDLRTITRAVPKKEISYHKSDYESGVQISTAPKCDCGRGTKHPTLGICSTCVIEKRYRMTTQPKRMRMI